MLPARFRTARKLLLASALALGVGGCETGLDLLDKLDFMSSQKKPIAGERRAVFPTGVPGIETNAQPAQPTNANVPLSMAPQTPATPEATPGRPAAPRAPRSAQQPKNPADAWDGTR